MTGSDFEITIPVLNEETTLDRNVLALHDFCMNNFEDPGQWNIVIADNGSIDNTREIAERLVSEHSNIGYISVDRRGVGLALRKAWRNSTADIIGSMDLDLSTDLRHLPEAISAIVEKKNDLVYATRLHEASRVKGRSLKREFISRAFNYMIKKYFRISISDSMCGFTFFKRSILEKLIANGAISDGWFFQAELLIVGEWIGLIVAELPVDWTDDKNSKARVFPLVIEYLREMKTLKKHLSIIPR